MPEPPKGYEWDPAMDRRCFAEYAFTFHDVVEVFNDPVADYLRFGPYTHPGDGTAEARFIAIGRLSWGMVIAVVYTMREGRRRIIWVRPARRNERAAFYAHNGIEAP